MQPCAASGDLLEGLPYACGLIAPGTDRPALDPLLMGIEVTNPTLAAACGLGNIDPQHGRDASRTAPAAIEACLNTPLPPAGSRLATIRPDLDALGAMAVLCLRARGRPIDRAVEARVARIAALDRFDRGPWPGPRPLPRTLNELADDWPGAELSSLSACVRDPARPLAARVVAVLCWLETGITPEGSIITRNNNETLLRSLRTGATQVEISPCSRFATVRSHLADALALGYRLAPICVALNSLFRFPDGREGRKYTIALWSDCDGDLDVVTRTISAWETGWGGQHGIKGSPQDRPSKLSYREVCQIMNKALDP